MKGRAPPSGEEKGGGGVGFLHGPLDIKLLVLYIMGRVAAPIGFDTLTELVMGCETVDYFLYAQEVSDLVSSGHLTLGEDGLYAITEKGRTNSAIMEDSLSTVIRGKCDRALRALNAGLRRAAQVTARLMEEAPDRCQVELGLADDAGPLLSLTLAVPSREQGQRIAARYRQDPEECFNAILACLLPPSPPKEE